MNDFHEWLENKRPLADYTFEIKELGFSHAQVVKLMGISWQAREASMYDMTKVYNDVAALLPDSRYMDPPDGGDVEIAEQIRRMIADKVEQAFIAGIAQGRKALPEWTDSMATEQYLRSVTQ